MRPENTPILKGKTGANKGLTVVARCSECGAILEHFEPNTKPLCMPCKTHNMTIAILKYPICGFGDE